MSAQCETVGKQAAGAAMSKFERYLSVWVALCIVAGIALGHFFPAPFQFIGRLEIANVNIPMAALIWLMIIPMLLKVDFGARSNLREHVRELLLPVAQDMPTEPIHELILAHLRARGASFLFELEDAVRSAHADTDSQTFKAALWDLVWAGQITNDTFAPLRALAATLALDVAGKSRAEATAED